MMKWRELRAEIHNARVILHPPTRVRRKVCSNNPPFFCATFLYTLCPIFEDRGNTASPIPGITGWRPRWIGQSSPTSFPSFYFTRSFVLPLIPLYECPLSCIETSGFQQEIPTTLQVSLRMTDSKQQKMIAGWVAILSSLQSTRNSGIIIKPPSRLYVKLGGFPSQMEIRQNCRFCVVIAFQAKIPF